MKEKYQEYFWCKNLCKSFLSLFSRKKKKINAFIRYITSLVKQTSFSYKFFVVLSQANKIASNIFLK